MKSAYERWLKFISRPSSESGLTFPSHEAMAIMRLPPIEQNWRRDKRDISRVAKRARIEHYAALRRTSAA